MGRWTHDDDDASRLPEGFRRTAYDADTGRYYFRDAHGQLWAGPAGSRFGELKPVSAGDVPDTDASDIEHGAPTPPAYTPPSPYRTLFPFLLIVATVLLLAWRLMLSPAYVPPAPAAPCVPGTEPYVVKAGDTCWRLAQARGSTVERVRAVNDGLDCGSLQIGERVCVPVTAPARRGTSARP